MTDVEIAGYDYRLTCNPVILCKRGIVYVATAMVLLHLVKHIVSFGPDG
jgi:hypothetical protein